MKERILNLLSIFIIIIYLCIWGYFVTIRTYYPKPKRSSEIPSNILWNPYEGEYYNSSDLKWNKKLKVYVPVSADYNHWHTDFSKAPSTHWREIHKTSGNIVNRAIFKYLDSHANSSNSPFSLVYDPIMDNRLKEIDRLGIKAIPQILNKMKTDNETSYILTNGLIFMTHVQTGPRDFRIKGSNLWVLSFVTKVKTSNASIKNAYRRFKLVISAEAKNKIKQEIAHFGIFGLPYAYEEYERGNKELYNIYVEQYGESFVKKNFTKRNIEEIREVVGIIEVDFL